MKTEAMEVKDAASRCLVGAEPRDVPPGYKHTDAGVIPISWEAPPIARVVRNIIDFRGRTPRKLGMEWGGGDIPALSARNVRMGFLDLNEETYYGSVALYERWMTNGEPQKGDVAFTTEAPLGNVAVIPDDRRYILSQRTILLQPEKDAVTGPFLFHILSSDAFQRELRENATGSTASGIQRRRFERIQIPLPPIPEQRVIAEALSDVDGLLAALEALIAKKRAIEQAAMQRLLGSKTRLPGFSGERKTTRLGELVQLSKVSVNPSITPDVVYTHFSLPAFDTNETPVVEAGALIGSNKYVVPPNSVLLSKLNPRIPRIWAPRDIPSNSVCSTEFLVLRPMAVDRNFLRYVCLSPGVCSQMELHAIGTTGSHQRIHPNQALAIEVVVPTDPAEQVAIATVLSDMNAEIAALAARRDKTRAIKQGMMQQLLTGRVRLVKRTPAEVSA